MALHRLCLVAILLISTLVLTNGFFMNQQERIYELIINKNITGLTHLKNYKTLRSCERSCRYMDCDCLYYQQFNYSCSLLDLNDCHNILNSTLPETNDTSTVLMVLQNRYGTRKYYSDYQIISNSVKYPNITFKSWSNWDCAYLCSLSSNCYGYSYKYSWCQFLVMDNCCNSTEVLLSDGNFIDLIQPIKWPFSNYSFIPPIGGEAPNITFDDDDSNRTSDTNRTTEKRNTIETTTKQKTSDTTETTSGPMCPCVCEEETTQEPPTEEELEILKDNLKKELAVDKKKLSKTIRAKTSAPDERRSAQGIGFIGVILLSALPIFILIIDLPQIYTDLKTFYTNVSSLCSNRTPR